MYLLIRSLIHSFIHLASIFPVPTSLCSRLWKDVRVAESPPAFERLLGWREQTPQHLELVLCTLTAVLQVQDAVSPKEVVILPEDGRDFKRTLVELNPDKYAGTQRGTWSGVGGRTFQTEVTARANTRRQSCVCCVQGITRSLVLLGCGAV